jgi:regulator of PEP synthase PpsR (kinase-PPPase family)
VVSSRTVLRVYQEEDVGFDSDSTDSGLDLEDCTDAVFYGDNLDDDDDDDDDTSCLPPGRNPSQTKMIFAVSDSTGVTAKSAIQKCLSQFGSCGGDRSEEDCEVQIRTFTFCRGEETIASLVKHASSFGKENKKAFMMFTIADPTLREQTLRMCELSGIPAVDLLGPSLDQMLTFLGRDPIGRAGGASSSSSSGPRRVGLSDSYYWRIEAVEFTLKADDGQAPWLLSEAGVIILGVSRTGKTPLSVVLSQSMGLKVANIPLVLEVPPPKELFESSNIDPNRIFCLTIAPSELKRIRTTRLERRNVKKVEEKYAAAATTMSINGGIHQSTYNDRAYVMNDLRNARDLSTKHGWTQIDVTGRSVEEMASFVSELLNERFDNQQIRNNI